MMRIDPVQLTEACPKFTLLAKRLRAALTGKIYFFNGQKNRVRVFDVIDSEVPFENYVETGTFLGMTTDFLARHIRMSLMEQQLWHLAAANCPAWHR